MAHEYKEGDIFRWAYKDETPGDRAPYNRYHCKSGICVLENGLLWDTFWGIRDSNASRWSPAVAERDLVLEFVANFADLDKAGEGSAEFYDDADCVNLNHSNSSRGNFYLRKGSERSAAKMLETARNKLERAQSEARTAARDIERLTETIQAIESGADIKEIWL